MKADQRELVSIPKTEYDWLVWFFQNADFGPADSDVKALMESYYQEKTGKLVPEEYKAE